MGTRTALICAATGFVTAACNLPAAPPDATASLTAGSTLTDTPRPVETPFPPPTSTAAATPASLITGACPAAASDAFLEPMTDVENYGDSLMRYLIGGGSAERLVAEAEAAAQTEFLSGQQISAQPDFNGDGTPELALALVNWWDDPLQSGVLYVAMCLSGEYRLAYSSPVDLDYPTPLIEAVRDLTGDGLDDLLVIRRGCGAHTCVSRPAVIAWGDGVLADRVEPVRFQLPTADLELIGPLAGGSIQLRMTGQGIASVGAGPYRKEQVTWTWDAQSGVFHAGEVELLDSVYRIHALHDADDLYAAGDFGAAIELYQRVIDDNSLEDWPPALVDDEFTTSRRLELSAYARLRLMLAWLQLGDPASAAAAYQALIAGYPAGEPGALFAELGEAFWESYASSGNSAAACQAALDTVAATREQINMALDYGYANRTYNPEDLCPGS